MTGGGVKIIRLGEVMGNFWSLRDKTCCTLFIESGLQEVELNDFGTPLLGLLDYFGMPGQATTSLCSKAQRCQALAKFVFFYMGKRCGYDRVYCTFCGQELRHLVALNESISVA